MLFINYSMIVEKKNFKFTKSRPMDPEGARENFNRVNFKFYYH